MHKIQGKSSFKIQIVSFNRRQGKWVFRIKVKSASKFFVKGVILKQRKGGLTYQLPFKLISSNNHTEKIEFEVVPNKIQLGSFYWDFFVDLDNGEFIRHRIKNPGYMVMKKLNKRLHISYDYGEYFFYPYLTVKNGLSLCCRYKSNYDKHSYIIKEKVALILYFLFKWYWNRKKIWLVYEKFSQTAQDNSYYFFKYSCDNKLTDNLYYVIKSQSKDYKYLFEYKNKVIEFMSIKHIIYILACKFIISSESRAHSYIWKENRGFVKRTINRKKHVFLQHGVLGLKKVDSIFKKGNVNGTNLFIASSEFEKDILIKHFGYTENEIIITGLARWDYLENKNKENQILLLPTWREWLDGSSDEDFKKSEFYYQYDTLLNSKSFIDLLEKNRITLKFCLHPRIHKFHNHFHSKSKNIKFAKYGEERINDLIMESSLLITDYSSVAWEMYYLKRPVVFFQFDINDEKYPGTYLDMDNEHFGDRCFNSSQLIKTLRHYIQQGFKEKKQFASMRNYFFMYQDKNNSKRIYQAIRDKEKQLSEKQLFLTIKNSDIYRSLRCKISS